MEDERLLSGNCILLPNLPERLGGIMNKGHVHGGVLTARFDYIKEKHGKNGLAEVFQKMRDEGYFGPTHPDEFKIAHFYPFDYLMRLMKAYYDLYGEESFDSMSRGVAKRKGVVGWFINWDESPESVIKKAAGYWPNFFDFGKVEGKVTGNKEGVLRGYDISPHPLFCRSLGHYYEGIFDYINAKDVEIRSVKCVHKGDKHCEWSIKWG